jgi:hypothetical protein
MNVEIETPRTEPLEGDSYASILCQKGDTKLIWNKNNADEVSNAKRTFDDLRKKGFLAFKVTDDGSKGEQINDFDANVERMIMVPPMVGG